MEYQQFYDQLLISLPIGTILNNPGGGTTKISSYTKDNLAYVRGKSKIRVSIHDLYSAYSRFNGQVVTSTELRAYLPRVFDSKVNGHSCNCTVLFMALKQMGLTGSIKGTGKRGDPFKVILSIK